MVEKNLLLLKYKKILKDQVLDKASDENLLRFVELIIEENIGLQNKLKNSEELFME